MTVAALEALTFGLGRLVEAASAAGHRLCLLTGDRGVYRHELARLSAEAAGALDIVDVDTHDQEACRAVLAALPDLGGLVNSTDTWSVPGADLAADLGLPGPDPASVRLLRDKARVRNLLHAQGLSRGRAHPVAAGDPALPGRAGFAGRAGFTGRAGFAGALGLPGDARTPDDAGTPGAAERRAFPEPSAAQEVLRAIGLPAVLKDSAGTSSRGVWLVRDERGLHEALAEAARSPLTGGLFAEPYLPGPVYSAETLSWRGETRLLGVLSRHLSPEPLVREEAAGFPVALREPGHRELEEWVAAVLHTAGHDAGFAHVEYALTTHGPELVEINRRIGGALVGEALCRALGVNVYEALIATTLGHRPALLDAPAPVPVPGPAPAPVPAAAPVPAPTDAGGGSALRATGFVLLYADRTGTLDGWDGLDGLHAHPGAPEWYPTMAPGQRVRHLTDQRGCTGILLAEGPTAELALHRALSAAGSVRPRITPDGTESAGPPAPRGGG